MATEVSQTGKLGTFLSSQKAHRAIFFAEHGDKPPWPCCFCDEVITQYGASGGENLIVHHLDQDQSNNSRENLAGCHWSCHSSAHMSDHWANGILRGHPRSPEARAAISQRMKGKAKSPEHVAKVRAALMGRKLSPEHAAKARRAFLGKRHSPEAIAAMSATAKARVIQTYICGCGRKVKGAGSFGNHSRACPEGGIV